MLISLDMMLYLNQYMITTYNLNKSKIVEI